MDDEKSFARGPAVAVDRGSAGLRPGTLAAKAGPRRRALSRRRFGRCALPHRRRETGGGMEAAGDRRQSTRVRAATSARRSSSMRRATATISCAARRGRSPSTSISTSRCPTTRRSLRPSPCWRWSPMSSPRARTCRRTTSTSWSPTPGPIPARSPMPARATARPRICRRRCSPPWRASNWCTCPTRAKARRWSTSRRAGSTSSSATSPPRCASRRQKK